MSLQWALVASFLYIEIGFIVLLLLPIISPKTWQKFFKSRFLKSLENQANLYFTGFLIILVLLFVDSIREMRKYSVGRESEIEHGHLDSELQFSMKLFRAQRNFYIAGFALFLCLVIRRLVLLIQKQAELMAQRDAALSQAKGASDAAQSMLDNKKVVAGDTSESAKNTRIERQDEEIKRLQKELAESKEEVLKLRKSTDAVKSQATSVTKEYDRLMDEHRSLQKQYEKMSGADANRKDR